MYLQHYIKLIGESPTTEDTNLHRLLRSFHSKVTISFPRVFFFNSCNFQGNVKASRLTGLLQWQKLTWFLPAFSLRFVDFAVQFCFRCKFSFKEERRSSGLTVARFFSTNHNSLLRIATSEIASFCIDHRSRQMAFLSCKGWAKAGQKAGFHVMLKYFEIKKRLFVII